MTIHRLDKNRAARELKIPGTFADGKGLYLRVRAPGQGSWTVKFGTREQSLGPADLISIDDARNQHHAMRVEKKAGRDPFALLSSKAIISAVTPGLAMALAGAGEPASETFGSVLDEYLAKAARDWKSGPGGSEEVNWRGMFAKVPEFMSLSIDSVTPKATAAAVEVYADQKPTQKRMRKRIKAVLKYAETRETRGKKHKVKHLAKLALKDIPPLMKELAALKDNPAARALSFTLHTAPRSGTTLKATWSEITEVDGLPTWIIPKEHIKTEDHMEEDDFRIPLTPQALACLGKHGKADELIFKSRIGKKGRLAHGAMQLLLKKLRPDVDVTVHGTTRSGFRDYIGDKTKFPRELGELALGHKIGDEDEQAYARGDQLEKRLELMQAWSDYISPLTSSAG